ncbi:MAG: 2-C-methyl-D-erythritol 4-phosphate cytidylyltransferase [Bacteroidetes bacterium]|nr:2-C-methyl-D-erythritol 4-phosphate cytidylyltransferase [Bacteroidota bacterium]
MKKIAVIVAGGSGLRMGSDKPKQFLALQHKTILWHSVNAFFKAIPQIEIILVCPKDFVEETKMALSDFDSQKIQITIGGATRFDSVKAGLSCIHDKSVIFVHDAVRCLVSTDLILRCEGDALKYGSAIPAISATDSMRIFQNGKFVPANRENIKVIQTPQVFLSEILLPAYAQEYKESFTDEASVVESAGGEIFLTEGDFENIKITRPTDLLLAQKILEHRQ